MEVIAPLEGKVLKLHVSVGDKVEVDDEILVLEAIKMETPIYADEGGTITEVRVKEGATVEEGAVLLVIG